MASLPTTRIDVSNTPTYTREEVEDIFSDNPYKRALALTQICSKFIPKLSPTTPISFKNADGIKNAFEQAFEVVDGPTRLVEWADQDFPAFIREATKLAAANAAVVHNSATGTFVIQTSVPESPLDDAILPDQVIDANAKESGAKDD